MRSIRSLLLLAIMLLTGCPPAIPAEPTAPLAVPLDPARGMDPGLGATLDRLTPGVSSLRDLTQQAGQPAGEADLQGGIALLYPSLWARYPHTVLVDRNSGRVRFVAIENVSLPLFSLRSLQASLGEPVQAFAAGASPSGYEHLFFPGAGRPAWRLTGRSRAIGAKLRSSSTRTLPGQSRLPARRRPCLPIPNASRSPPGTARPWSGCTTRPG